jgi:phosphoenolpyruvate synthase/pyruvate phosphate dikinase
MAQGAARYTRGLQELGAGDAADFGGKSASLGELLRAGIEVPPGFALSTGAFGAARFDAAADDPRAAILAAPIPDAVRDQVNDSYAGLPGESPPVAVRSSALGEDSAEATFAGQQDTYLWVRGAGDVCAAVRNCWASLYSDEAVSYRARFGGAAAETPAMGVTVQLMVDAAISGVMFSCNPVSGDRSMVAINASWGLGLAVVGGEVTPDDHLVSKITHEVVRETISDKAVEYVPDPSGTGTARIDVDEERRRARCLDDDALKELVDLAKRVEQHFGSPQDIEWAITGDGELYVLQSRPVTGLKPSNPAPAPVSALDLVMSKFGAKP